MKINKLPRPQEIEDSLMKKKKKPAIYVLDHKLKWKTFKELQDKLVKDSGPVPVQGDKALWHLLRDKRIYLWFDPLVENDMGIGLELPKREYKIIINAQ